MIRKYLLPLLAVGGVAFGFWTVMTSNQPIPAAPPVAQPSQAPFVSFVAGAGIIEASTENIAVGTPVSGVVTDIFVRVGQAITVGDPLFELDDRNFKAELAVRQTALRQAKERLARLKSMPRPEGVPEAQARVKEAEASLADAKTNWRWPRAYGISVPSVRTRSYGVGSPYRWPKPSWPRHAPN